MLAVVRVSATNKIYRSNRAVKFLSARLGGCSPIKLLRIPRVLYTMMYLTVYIRD